MPGRRHVLALLRRKMKRCSDLALSSLRPVSVVSAAAAVAEAASEALASAPPAIAAALSVLDPARPASCATDLENTARDAADRS